MAAQASARSRPWRGQSLGYDRRLSAESSEPSEVEAESLDLPESPFENSLERDVRQHEVFQRLFPQPADAETPPRLGRFAVLRVLGQGGMGRVYAAYDEDLDRRVAVKVLRHQEDARSRQRSLREAQAMAKLSHPNVVNVFEVGEHASEVFIAMEYVQGTSLADWQAERSRPWREIVEVYRQAGEGLAAAHEAGIVHRDFKPTNVMVEPAAGEQWRARVLDFGLAFAGADGDAEDIAAASAQQSERGVSVAQTLTATHGPVGTPAYMPPEQFEGRAVEGAADQFSWCVSLWEALYGERPFDESSVSSMLASRREGPRTPTDRPQGLPPTLHTALLQGLHVDPASRFASMRALLEAMAPPTSSGRALAWTTAVGLVALVGGVALGQSSGSASDACEGAIEALGTAWDDGRQAAVREAMLAVEPFGEGAWAYAGPRLDTYASAWTDGHTDACRANRDGQQSDAILDTRMRCLASARRELDATTQLLAGAQPKVVEQAARLVESLPDLADCRELDRLQSDVPPPSAEQATEVEAIATELARARAELAALRYDEAARLSAPLIERSRATGYAPVLTEVALTRAGAVRDLGEFDDARGLFSTAFSTAVEVNQWAQALRAATGSAIMASFRGNGDAAAVWVAAAEGIAGRIGSSHSSYLLEHARGRVAEYAGRYVEAREHYERAFAATEQTGDVLSGATVLGQLSHMNWMIGDRERALEIRRRCIDTLVTQLGPDHPRAAVQAGNLAMQLASAGRTDEADEMSARSIATLAQAWGEHSLALLSPRSTRVQILRLLGRPQKAEVLARSVVEDSRRLLGPEHLDTLNAQAALAASLLMQERHEEGVPLMAKTVEAMARTAGPEHEATLFQMHNYGVSLRRTARLEDAETTFAKLVETLARTSPPSHPDLLAARVELAGVHTDQQRYQLAADELEDLIEATTFEERGVLFTLIHNELSRAYLELGHHQAAARSGQAVWDRLETEGGDPSASAQAAYTLALAHGRMGDEEAAAEWTRRAHAAHDAVNELGARFEYLDYLRDRLAAQ